jgi:hypothetical protein
VIQTLTVVLKALAPDRDVRLNLGGRESRPIVARRKSASGVLRLRQDPCSIRVGLRHAGLSSVSTGLTQRPSLQDSDRPPGKTRYSQAAGRPPSPRQRPFGRNPGRWRCGHGSWLPLLASFGWGLLGCARGDSPPADAIGPAPAASTPLPPAPARIAIPGGSFFAGTRRGEFGRIPALEPRRSSVTLGPFEIDAALFPGRDAPRTGLTRAQAAIACGERGGRLCSELEWERACKGPESTSFPTGEELDPACDGAPSGCASGFGVRGFGSLREWTASDLPGYGQAVVRGASVDAAQNERRCAHRTRLFAGKTNSGIGFRCCYGSPNARSIDTPPLGAAFSPMALEPETLEGLLAADPRTRRIASGIHYFEDPEGSAEVRRKGPGGTKGFSLTVAPLRWNPVAGAEFLVVSARSGESTSFVVVLYVLEESRYALASSYIMEAEAGPIALAYNGYQRPRLHFSSCWGCPGETGTISYRDPDQAVISQP